MYSDLPKGKLYTSQQSQQYVSESIEFCTLRTSDHPRTCPLDCFEASSLHVLRPSDFIIATHHASVHFHDCIQHFLRFLRAWHAAL
jgi:hypothetical protein